MGGSNTGGCDKKDSVVLMHNEPAGSHDAPDFSLVIARPFVLQCAAARLCGSCK